MNTPTPAGVSLSAPEQGLAKERRVILQTDRVMRVYIAGPMTGLPEFNFPAFNAMAEVLRADGWHVENPAEHGHVDGAEWGDYLRYDISRLSTCSAMMLLPGWSSSRGARLEVSIAKELGHEMLYAVGAEQMPTGFDRVTAERDALQQRLNAADELADHNARVSAIAVEDVLLLQSRVDVLEGLLFALPDGLKDLSGCENTAGVVACIQYIEYLIGELKPTESAKCCTVSVEDQALLNAGDCTPEELFGVGGKPSCPKCAS